MKPHPSSSPHRSGVALLITLLILSLITIIAVAFLGTMSWEMTDSRRNLENQKARAFSTLGMNAAVGQLRSSLGPWDNPFVNFTNAPPNFYWSVSPGILTHWAFSSAAPISNYPLFSIGSTNLVNLNAVSSDGTYPILGGGNDLSVYWVNVLKNPAVTTASAANPIIGRYAYWIDDENAKVNINTADGSLKYTANSIGLGTPSEVSLQVLQQGGAAISTTLAGNIVSFARTTGFNTPREILRTTGSTTDLYANNVGNLTAWGRSPEINVFGEPKINFITASITNNLVTPPSLSKGYLEINNITGQSLTEIYPTPYQRPAFSYNNPNNGGAAALTTNQFEVFPQEWPMFAGAAMPSAVPPAHYYYNAQEVQGDRASFMMDLISRYEGGTNCMNQAVQWPVFPYPSVAVASATPSTSSGTSGFIGKYSLRQLDALSAQITDLGAKDLTPDAVNLQVLGTAGYPLTIASNHGGLLSHQLVSGLGRAPRVDEIMINLNVFPYVTGTTPQFPYITMSLYLETYLPAGFAGVDLLNINNGFSPGTTKAGTLEFGGSASYVGDLNLLDMPASSTGNFPNPFNTANCGEIPRMLPQPYADPIGDPAHAQVNDYWGDVLLQNNAGIDFAGNPTTSPDADQIRATAYHLGYPTNASGQYMGTAPVAQLPLLRMGYLSSSTLGAKPGLVTWFPGQYRTISNTSSSAAYKMMTNAASALGNLTLSGGLVINAWGRGNNAQCDPIKTPFESSVRGDPVTGLQSQANSYDCEDITTNALAWVNSTRLPTPGNSAQTTYSATELLRDRVMKGVIPVNFSVAIPPATTSAAAPGNSIWYHVEVADPMVNQFAGDWIPLTNSDNTMGVGNGSAPTITGGTGGYSIYYNGQNISSTAATANSSYYDPDSFWLPTLDPKIPRSARMPNIGYLNYQRTGVIPDDETVAVNLQHGTPYRCLNFNAVNDASQMAAVTAYRATGYYYPDWALLDLFSTPSTLLPYNGPYGYYNSSGAWTAGTVMTGNPTNMYNYGTWGGSTPGRINPNGSVFYTTNVSTPTPGLTRTLPVQALLHNIAVNQTISTGTSATTATTNAPTFSGGTVVDDAGLASSIATYISTYGPLREPAEICNIPAVSANYAHDSTHYNPTRNDLVRQIVGNITTQSNTFSVWVAGQSISKTKGNTDYANYQSGDQILGTVRYHFVVERYLDPGADGVIGNATLPAGTTVPTSDIDQKVGTYDDPMNLTYHPPNPKYLYRIVYAEEIRN